jgi:hypothetical protein
MKCLDYFWMIIILLLNDFQRGVFLMPIESHHKVVNIFISIEQLNFCIFWNFKATQSAENQKAPIIIRANTEKKPGISDAE